MSDHLQSLLQQKEALDAQIAEHKKEATAQVIASVNESIAAYGLTAKDLKFPGGKIKRADSGKPVAAKYRDPESGATWSGRGKPPRWIGADREAFAIREH